MTKHDCEKAHVAQMDQMDQMDQIGNAYPNLSLGGAAQDLCSTYPTKEACSAVDHADCTGSIKQHKLDHTDQELIFPERSRSSSGNR